MDLVPKNIKDVPTKVSILTFVFVNVLFGIPFVKYWHHDFHRTWIEERNTKTYKITKVNSTTVDVMWEDGYTDSREKNKLPNINVNDTYIANREGDGAAQIIVTIVHLVFGFGIFLFVYNMIVEPFYIIKINTKPKHIVKGYIQ